VRAVKPQVVMIELCAARKGILTVQKLKVQPPVTCLRIHAGCCQHASPAVSAVQVPTTSEMLAQVRQGQPERHNI
jgi:hypothetical protein